jgi:hypothetical protein
VTWLLGVVVVAVIAGLAAWLVLSAVRRTVTRQETGLPPLPDCPPAGPPLVGLTLEPAGLRVDHDGGPWCIPVGELRGVQVASHHAGKEVYADKVLVVDWQLGPRVLRSGFALDEETAPTWAARLRPLVAP